MIHKFTTPIARDVAHALDQHTRAPIPWKLVLERAPEHAVALALVNDDRVVSRWDTTLAVGNEVLDLFAIGLARCCQQPTCSRTYGRIFRLGDLH